MYDFNLGNHEYIEKNEDQYLLSIKRMLPRWLNSISDSIFLKLHKILCKQCDRKGVVLAETGVGASTILFAYHAMKNQGHLFSWDIAGPKGSELRKIINETLCRTSGVSIWDTWTFVPAQSLSPFLGIPIVKELNRSVDFFYCDGDHTWKTIEGEITAFASIASRESVFAMDDAYLEHRCFNTSYINTMRNKLGLPAVDIPDNSCRPFGALAKELLEKSFSKIENLETGPEKEEEFDILYSYSIEEKMEDNLKAMNDLATNNSRFLSWKTIQT
jgi:hypothetical protein